MKKLNRIIELLDGILYQLELANWQRNGGKGSKPRETKQTWTFDDKTVHAASPFEIQMRLAQTKIP